MASYMPPSHMPLEPKWRHYPTYIYDRNYGYGMNYYQPMIDYIDSKRLLPRSTTPTEFERGGAKELPELPWSDGRALWQDRRVTPYARDELIRRAIDAEDEARDHLSRFKVTEKRARKIADAAESSRAERERRSGRDTRTRRSVFPSAALTATAWPFRFLNLVPRKAGSAPFRAATIKRDARMPRGDYSRRPRFPVSRFYSLSLSNRTDATTIDGFFLTF